MGHALDIVQQGLTPQQAKALKGFSGASVLELVTDYHTDTYRAIYTVRFPQAIYVLHCFQKKSKQGVKTPPKDLEL